LANICPDKRPPSTLIVVSKTCGFVFTSKDTHCMTFFTAVSNPSRSSRMTSVSRTSISVREKLPATSFVAMLSLVYLRCQSCNTLNRLTYGFPQSGPFPEHDRGVSFDAIRDVCCAGTLMQADLVQRERYGPLLMPTRCTRHWNITKSHVVVEPMVP